MGQASGQPVGYRVSYPTWNPMVLWILKENKRLYLLFIGKKSCITCAKLLNIQVGNISWWAFWLGVPKHLTYKDHPLAKTCSFVDEVVDEVVMMPNSYVLHPVTMGFPISDVKKTSAFRSFVQHWEGVLTLRCVSHTAMACSHCCRSLLSTCPGTLTHPFVQGLRSFYSPIHYFVGAFAHILTGTLVSYAVCQL